MTAEIVNLEVDVGVVEFFIAVDDKGLFDVVKGGLV